MFKRYSLIKTLTKNFNILSNADADANADANADADADAGVTAIALPVLSYRRAKNGFNRQRRNKTNDTILCLITGSKNQRTIGPENAHLKPDPAVLSHHEITFTLNTHTPLLNS